MLEFLAVQTRQNKTSCEFAGSSGRSLGSHQISRCTCASSQRSELQIGRCVQKVNFFGPNTQDSNLFTVGRGSKMSILTVPSVIKM